MEAGSDRRDVTIAVCRTAAIDPQRTSTSALRSLTQARCWAQKLQLDLSRAVVLWSHLAVF